MMKVLEILKVGDWMRVNINLLGTPCTTTDQTEILFKYQKAEAVFYYIAYYKSVQRTKIMNLFWPEMDETNGRKNLRNALYAIRQAFGTEVISNVGQRQVSIHEAITLNMDWDSENVLNDGIIQSSQVFLDGFYIKEAPDFETWVETERERLRELRVQALEERMAQDLESGQDPEHACKQLLMLEPYHEEAVRILMSHYAELGQIGKGMEVYSHLERVLDDELALKPEPKTTALFNEIVSLRRSQKSSTNNPKPFFYGRTEELDLIALHLNHDKALGNLSKVVITGEAGIGKTTLIKKCLSMEALDETSPRRLGITCHEGDQKYLLKPWYPLVIRFVELLNEQGDTLSSREAEIISSVFPTVLSPLQTVSSKAIEKSFKVPMPLLSEVIAQVVIRICKHSHLVLFIEDLHWMDEGSLELLKLFCAQLHDQPIQLMMTGRGAGHWLEKVTTGQGTLHLKLNRFSSAETLGFIEVYPGRPDISKRRREEIYDASEGNPLMLTEIMNSCIRGSGHDQMSSKVKQIQQNRYQNLSHEAQKLADLLSVFAEDVGWQEIRALNTSTDMQLLDLVEELIHSDFIKESEDCISTLNYAFTHHQLKAFVYEGQSLTKRRLLHKRICDYYKEQLTQMSRDRVLYPRLIYHAERSGDLREQIRYRVRSIFDYLEIYHELFPKIKGQSQALFQSNEDYSHRFIAKEVEEIEKAVKQLSDREKDEDFEIEYLSMISRYHIITGDSEVGIEATRRMIELAESIQKFEYAFKGHLQLIYSAINLRKIPEMETLIEMAFDRFKASISKGELGILIRLKGYLMVLKDRHRLGERLLMNAAKIFERPEYQKPYALNLIAAYYYLGESHRLSGNGKEAKFWYEKAKTQCLDQGFSGHLALVESSLGILLYDQKAYDPAHEQLQKAIEQYEKTDFKWGHISAYAYWGLSCLRQGQQAEGEKHIQYAEQLAKDLGFIYEKGLMLRIKAEACCIEAEAGSIKAEAHRMNAAAGCINGDGSCSNQRPKKMQTERYCLSAITYFNEHESFSYEKKVMADLKLICGQCLQS